MKQSDISIGKSYIPRSYYFDHDLRIRKAVRTVESIQGTRVIFGYQHNPSKLVTTDLKTFAAWAWKELGGEEDTNQ